MPPAPGFWAHLPNEMPAEEVIMHYEAQLEASDGWVGDNFPKRWSNFGPGILAGLIGAKVGLTKIQSGLTRMETRKFPRSIRPLTKTISGTKELWSLHKLQLNDGKVKRQ